MVVDSLCERDDCQVHRYVFLLIFLGKHQSDDEAKYNMCSVFSDISHF